MDCCLSFNKPYALQSLPRSAAESSFRGHRRLLSGHRPSIPSVPGFFGDRSVRVRRRTNQRSLIAVAINSFCSLNTPVEPKSLAGKFLTSVFLDDIKCFHVAVGEQLEQLAADRAEAESRFNLSLGSDEACLHRRIAELRETACQMAVEDIMYLLILYKFKAIGVQLVPRLSQCIYNRRLEIWPNRDWELESIHSFEALEMIREHLTTVIGWRADSTVTDNWATTEIPRLRLCQVYAASMLYGYFLKSASLRHHLELSLAETKCDLISPNPLFLPELWSCGLKNMAFGGICSIRSTSGGQELCSQGKKCEKLRCYVMGFDPDTLQMCAKPKTKEAVNLIERHSCALFDDEKTGVMETEGVILTSLSSLKRMVLEAVAFGSFLWDTEEYVDTVYKLKENC